MREYTNDKLKTALVMGAGGFIGSHLVKRLKSEGYWVRGVDIKHPEFESSAADEFFILDLSIMPNVVKAITIDKVLSLMAPGITVTFDEVYQLAADMGGAGYIFTGEHDANVMHNSALINLHTAETAAKLGVGKVFYSSSACMYPTENQTDPNNPNCEEGSAYPANPDSEYGWEKLFSERLYLSYMRNRGLDVRIARFHNIFGPQGTFRGGREKAPAAICRKIAMAQEGESIEIWGDGKQTRSFLYIDDCIEGIRRLMQSDFTGPVNIGSTEMTTINDLVETVRVYAGKYIKVVHVDGPQGVRGRNSDNKLIKEKLGWEPTYPLVGGIIQTYNWIEQQLNEQT